MKALRFAAALLCIAWVLPAADALAQKKISDGQVSKTAPNWPSFIAVEKGFFRREGVELETAYVGNVANTVQQLVAGSFDVASSTFDTAIRAIANGGNAVMIGGIVTKYPYSIMTAADVATAADMKGKRVILPFPKDLLTIVWNRWLTEKGMRPDDVEQVYAGATPNRLAALVSGAVQAALLTQPFDFRAAADGYKKLIDIGAFGKEYGFLTVLARPQWLRDNPDTARGYLKALSRRRRLAVRPGQSRRGDRDPRQGHPAQSGDRRADLRSLRQGAAAVQPQARDSARHCSGDGEDPDRARRHQAGRGRQDLCRSELSAEVTMQHVRRHARQ